MAITAPKTSAELASELGRAQQAYKTYGASGRADLQKGASSYADQLRAAAKSSGMDLSSYGTKNANGMDYTSNYTGSTPNAYDPTQAGHVAAPVVNKPNDVIAAGDSSTPVSVQPNNNTASLINSRYDQNYASQLQKLQEARQIQQQGLNQQETGVSQNALQSLNNNDAMATSQLKRLQEVQANNGVNGGDSITATIGNQTAQQQGANAINQDKANQLNDIMQKRSLINNNASANDLALMQQLQAARSGQLIDNNNTQDQRAIQLAQLMGKTADGSQTLAGQQFQYAQGQDALQNAFQNRQQDFNENMGNKQFDAQQAQTSWNQAFQNKQFDQQKASTLWDQTFKDNSFQKSVDQFSQQMGMDYSKMNQQQQQFVADQAFKNKSLEMQNNPNSLDNKYKQARIDNLNKPAPAPKGTSDYKTDPEFAKDFQASLNDPDAAAKLKANSAAFIKAYGLDGYQALLNAVPKPTILK